MENPDESEIMTNVINKIDAILENHEVPELSSEVLAELAKWEEKYSVMV
jgi:trimethylamine--corrinoid protein Co-methyltransferase